MLGLRLCSKAYSSLAAGGAFTRLWLVRCLLHFLQHLDSSHDVFVLLGQVLNVLHTLNISEILALRYWIYSQFGMMAFGRDLQVWSTSSFPASSYIITSFRGLFLAFCFQQAHLYNFCAHCSHFCSFGEPVMCQVHFGEICPFRYHP